MKGVSSPLTHDESIPALTLYANALKNSVEKDVAMLEKTDTDFSKLTVAERAANVEALIPTVRAQLRDTPAVVSSEQSKDIKFYYFCMSYTQFLKVAKEGDMLLLSRLMRQNGGYLSEQLFCHLSDNVFHDYVSRQRTSRISQLYFVGCTEILLSSENDVKRMCFLGVRQQIATEKDELVETMGPLFPDAIDVLSVDGAMDWLQNPQSDPDMLKRVAEQIMQDSPEMGTTVHAYFSLCANCGKDGTLRCSRCKKVRYCSPECQGRHWKIKHRTECSVVAAAAAEKNT